MYNPLEVDQSTCISKVILQDLVCGVQHLGCPGKKLASTAWCGNKIHFLCVNAKLELFQIKEREPANSHG